MSEMKHKMPRLSGETRTPRGAAGHTPRMNNAAMGSAGAAPQRGQSGQGHAHLAAPHAQHAPSGYAASQGQPANAQPYGHAPQAAPMPDPRQAPILGDDLSSRVHRAAMQREADAAAARVRAINGAGAHQHAPQTESMHQEPSAPPQAAPIPSDFGLDKEHPMLRIPFSLQIEGRRYEGQALSITQMIARADDGAGLPKGKTAVAWLQISFDGFSVLLQPEVVSGGLDGDGNVILQFTDPTGPHVPQLRYVMNSYIAGDVVSMGGMLSYTGPDKPATPKQSPQQVAKNWLRSMTVMALSALCAVLAAFVIYNRYTTGHEMHPVFVERAGQQMRATVAGQIAYLNPNAVRGDVLYAVNGNTGDVLNFVMPCDCGVTLQNGISEGTTVLPTDLVATVYEPQAPIQLKSMMSVDGLARAMRGANVYIDLDTGRSVPVTVVAGEAARAAVQGGEVFVPVDLVPEPGALTAEDIGRSARIRMTPNLAARFGLS